MQEFIDAVETCHQNGDEMVDELFKFLDTRDVELTIPLAHSLTMYRMHVKRCRSRAKELQKDAVADASATNLSQISSS